MMNRVCTPTQSGESCSSVDFFRKEIGIRSPFPCLDGEQLGSVAGLHVMQLPEKVFLSG
jgi:hypothetical protein